MDDSRRLLPFPLLLPLVASACCCIGGMSLF
jgi:hypothetical protein